MLNNFVIPASVSSGHAVEGVQPIQGFAPYNQLTELMPTFSLADDGAKPEDEEKKKTAAVEEGDSEKETEEESSIQELLRIAFDVSFKEMLKYFLVPEEQEIRDLQYRFRNQTDVNNLTIFAPKGGVPAEFQSLRDKLYEIQMQLFQTPKGIHCHIVI